MKDDSNFNYFQNSRKGSDLRRIFDKRKPDGSFCFLSSMLDHLGRIEQFDLDQAFFTMNKLAVFYTISMFSKFAKDMSLVVFESQTILDNEQIQANFFLRSLEANLKNRLRLK